jgi:hypothetical protein
MTSERRQKESVAYMSGLSVLNISLNNQVFGCFKSSCRLDKTGEKLDKEEVQ